MQTLEFPYAGTSGWAGSNTSRDRALQQDSDGTFNEREKVAINLLRVNRNTGATWRDLALYANLHHGQASGVLSILHKQEKIARLTNRRDKCAIYVLPEFVSDRETSEHRNTRASENIAIILAVRELHTATVTDEVTEKTYCKECQYEYPCDTIKLVGAE
jgi:hypothetical protein